MSAPLVERRTWRRVRVSLVRERADQPYAIRSGGSVASLVRTFLRDDPREHFVAVYLDARHRPIALHDAAIGTGEGCPIDPRAVFGPAMALSAAAIVVAHNHPSGDPTPSSEDRAVTDRLRSAGELLGVRMLDHLGDRRRPLLLVRRRVRTRVRAKRCLVMDADPIDAYTRAQALADGVLIDVARLSSPAEMHGGFACPQVAVTAALWAAIEAIPERLDGIADARGRLHDVLWMAASAARQAKDRHRSGVCFRVILPRQGERARVVTLRLDIRPGDAGEPVITIGFPEDF